MSKKHHISPNLYDILGQTEVMEGNSKVIITEYNNGARSYSKVRPKHPFYKHAWFYLVMILVLLTLLVVEHYLL